VLGTNQKLTRMQVQELFLIRANGGHVVRRLKDASEAGQIIEPKLGGSINMVIRQPRELFAGRVALNVAPHILLHLGKRTEQRRVLVAMVGDELVVAHPRLAAKKYGHLDHAVPQYEHHSYNRSDAFLPRKMHPMKKKARAYHHGDLKAAMIQAALELVRKKGPRGFTLNEASRVAGVSVSAPYNHFKDKEALLIEIVLLGSSTLEMELRAAADTADSPRQRLLAVYLAYVAFAQHHPDLFAVMFQSGIDKTPYPEVHASAARAFEVGAQLAAQIEPSQTSAGQLAMAVWTMAHGFAALSIEGDVARIGFAKAGVSAEELARRLLFPDSSSE
jgi:AcrR family transcriptional regulator